jgi:hypothetical protein
MTTTTTPVGDENKAINQDLNPTPANDSLEAGEPPVDKPDESKSKTKHAAIFYGV